MRKNKEKRKIVIVADFVYPNYTGGSARYVYDMIKGFYENDIDFLLITRKKRGIFAIEENDKFFEKLKKENKVLEISSLKDIFISFKIINKYDILNIHHPVLGIIYSFLTNKKIYFFHGPFHKEYKRVSNNKFLYLLKYLLQKIVLLRASKVLVLSNFMKKEVEELVSNKEIIIIGPIFDMKKFSLNIDKRILREKYNISRGKIVLFTSRRLTSRTGVIEFTKLFIDYFDEEKYELVIVGKGELQQQLQDMIKEKNNTKYFEFVSDKKLIELMKLSDVYVLPTKELEGFGLVILEALSLRLPVIVSNKAGGGKEFIEQVDKNLIFELGNIKSLKNSINYALNLNIDFIYKKIKKFDLKIQSRNIYENLL